MLVYVLINKRSQVQNINNFIARNQNSLSKSAHIHARSKTNSKHIRALVTTNNIIICNNNITPRSRNLIRKPLTCKKVQVPLD
jgi:hypothetical protein